LPSLKMGGAAPPHLMCAFVAYMWATLPSLPLHYL